MSQWLNFLRSRKSCFESSFSLCTPVHITATGGFPSFDFQVKYVAYAGKKKAPEASGRKAPGANQADIYSLSATLTINGVDFDPLL